MNSQIAFEELPHKGVHAPLWLTVFLLWGASPPFIALAKAMKAGYGVAGADEDDRQEHRCESTHKCEFTPNFTAVIDSVSSALMMLLIPVEQREFMPDVGVGHSIRAAKEHKDQEWTPDPGR